MRAEKILFTTGDGSILQRLNSLYNRSKHIASAIYDNRIAPGSTLAVWLDNEGLRAVDGHLTFDEMAEILEELARWSDAAQDPLTMREKILTQYRPPATRQTNPAELLIRSGMPCL